MSVSQQGGMRRFIVNVSAVVGLFWLLHQIWDTLSAPTRSLEANVNRIDYALFPKAVQFRASVAEAIKPDSVEKMLQELSEQNRISSNWKDDPTAPYQISSFLQQALEVWPGWPDSSPDRYLTAEITNTGQKPVTGATLRVAGANIAVVIREDDTFIEVIDKPSIPLGSIAAGEIVRVRVWGDFMLAESDKVGLSHDDDIGVVRFADDPTFIEFLEKNHLLPLVPFGALIIALFACIAIIDRERLKRAVYATAQSTRDQPP